MSTNKPTLVIIHGAFLTPESYNKLTTALESAGYEVHVPRLPTVNEARPPNSSLNEDSTFIRRYVESLIRAGRTVVAIGHSYGGQVMSSALYGLGSEARSSQGLKGGVSDLIYLAGYALQEGESTFGKFSEFGNLEALPVIMDRAEDHTAVLIKPTWFLGLEGSGLEETEIEAFLKTLARWNGAASVQPLEKAAWREIPVTYIHTLNDGSILFPEQQSMTSAIEKAGRKVQTFTLDTGHSPNLTATQDVVEIVNKVVSG